MRGQHIQDTVDLYDDIANGTLPAVSFVKPSGLVDGHPASSKLDLFEGFVQEDRGPGAGVAELWKDTAIFITLDEGGGYYDSGYVQPLDFFGDGTRIPLIVVVAVHRARGHISHEYADHVSILKFIERNWRLLPVTCRSRDNFPNPVSLPEQSLRAVEHPGARTTCSTSSPSRIPYEREGPERDRVIGAAARRPLFLRIFSPALIARTRWMTAISCPAP